MDKRIGFIGAGNMGCAMISGIISSGIVDAKSIFVSDENNEALESLRSRTGVNTSSVNREVARVCDVLFLSVKPYIYGEIIDDIKDVIPDGSVVVSIAPGITIDFMEKRFGGRVKLIRTMPNTPALVGEGMMGMCPGTYAAEFDVTLVREICSSFARTEIVPEKLMDVVTAVSGSSPAYVYMFIEAMADAAVLGGMPRAQAYSFAAQAVYGSAKMVLETGRHPGELKDMVCSPGGTTIRAVKVLEENGFRAGVMEAMEECIRASKGD